MDFRPEIKKYLPPLTIAREAEIVDELAEHLDDLYRELRAEGLDHDAARARTLATLPEAIEEFAQTLRSASRSAAGRASDSLHVTLDEPVSATSGAFSMFTDLRRDIRYAFRAFIHAPGFTAVAVITLAVGIGATAVIFSAVNALLLKSPPVRRPDRLVSIYTLHSAGSARSAGGRDVGGSSYLDYLDMRNSHTLTAVAACADVLLSLDNPDGAEQIPGEIVSGNYFSTLGVPAAVGRTFAREEDQVDSPVHVVIISFDFFEQRFGGDRAAIGRSIVLNGSPYAVIGVAPRGFTGIQLGDAPSVWVPMALQEEVRPPSAGVQRRLGSRNLLSTRSVRWLSIIGRLQDGQSVSGAASALDVIGRRLAGSYPESNRDLSLTALPLGDGPGVRRQTTPLLALLGAAVLLVLLIACANMASLLLARAVNRRREVAVRIAIGASRGQLLRQWLTEAIILGVIGALGGLIVASAGKPLLYGLGIPSTADLGMNIRVLAFTLSVGILSGIVFGLAPAVQLRRRNTVGALREEGGNVATGLRATRLRNGFVIAQVALSLVLLVGAGLLTRTILNAYAVDLGYRVDHVLLATISPGASGYSQEKGESFYRDLLDRLNAIPGVQAAGAARVTVLSGRGRTTGVSLDGQPIRMDLSNVMMVDANVVSPEYFAAMGIHLTRGRAFTLLDGPSSPHVAIVSESLAERLWPGANPIGRMVRGLQVVGVVPDTVYMNPTDPDPRPLLYTPLAQNYESAVTLHIRTQSDPISVLPSVRRTIRQLDPQIVVTNPTRLLDVFERAVADQRTMAMLVGLFGVIALALAAVGLYGVMDYVVRQRRSEMGLRLALGATPASLLNLIVGRGVRLVAIGIGIGLAGAFAGSRLIQSRLFEITPTDPITWIVAFGVLITVGTLACLVPAWRATRTDPAIALKAS